MKKIGISVVVIMLAALFLGGACPSSPPPGAQQEGTATSGAQPASTASAPVPAPQPAATTPPPAPAPQPASTVPAAPAAKPQENQMSPEQLNQKIAKLTPADMEKLTAVIETSRGIIKFKFFPQDAPETCRNFIKLAANHFYDGLIFHRIIAGFMIQGGDPQGTGAGGPGYHIKAEFNNRPHVLGTVSMARTNDPDSAGSQFFICLGVQSFLDHKYTGFGQVSEGIEVVKAIGATPTDRSNDRPVEPQIMKKVYIEGL